MPKNERSVWSHHAEQAAQAVEGLNHRGDECGISAVAWKNLADGQFQPADQFLGFLTFLIGHSRSPPHETYQIFRGSRAAQGTAKKGMELISEMGTIHRI